MLRTLIFVQCMFAMTLTGSEDVYAAFLDGNRLYELCKSEDGAERIYCEFYVAGVADALQAPAKKPRTPFEVCIPTNVSPPQIADMALKLLEERPEDRHFSARSLVWIALDASFRCEE